MIIFYILNFIMFYHWPFYYLTYFSIVLMVSCSVITRISNTLIDWCVNATCNYTNININYTNTRYAIDNSGFFRMKEIKLSFGYFPLILIIDYLLYKS